MNAAPGTAANRATPIGRRGCERRRSTLRLVAAIVGSMAAALPSLEAAAQLGPGQPNISGAWERYMGAPRAADDEPIAPNVPPRESAPPLKAEYLGPWEARRQRSREADARGEPLATGYTFCLPDGMPSMMGGPFPLEILQSPGQVTIVQEAYNQIRRIYLDEPQVALEDMELGFYGRSVGRWDGDTLAVDTIGVKDYVRFRDAPHSQEMRISERIRLVAPDILWDEITIHDPQVLEAPWTVTFAYRRMPDYEIMEYICENNREYADEDGVTRLRTGGSD